MKEEEEEEEEKEEEEEDDKKDDRLLWLSLLSLFVAVTVAIVAILLSL